MQIWPFLGSCGYFVTDENCLEAASRFQKRTKRPERAVRALGTLMA